MSRVLELVVRSSIQQNHFTQLRVKASNESKVSSSCDGASAHTCCMHQETGSDKATRSDAVVGCRTDVVQNIPNFLKTFSGEVDISEAAEPLESFKTFNEVCTHDFPTWIYDVPQYPNSSAAPPLTTLPT